MKMEFTKMHGTGNDYVYVNCMEQELPNPGAISEYVSHRRFGIGSDGLICVCKSDVADFPRLSAGLWRGGAMDRQRLACRTQ